jgi:hypothetical protein
MRRPGIAANCAVGEDSTFYASGSETASYITVPVMNATSREPRRLRAPKIPDRWAGMAGIILIREVRPGSIPLKYLFVFVACAA